MKTNIKISAMTLILCVVSPPLLGGEGKALHEQSYTGCHSTEVMNGVIVA
jgi:hypothetical protein